MVPFDNGTLYLGGVSGSLQKFPLGFRACAVQIISGSEDGIVRIWDVRLGTESQEQLHGHTHAVLGVSISPNGASSTVCIDGRNIKIVGLADRRVNRLAS